jgi:dolichol-phosphate mannosyltransferase
MNNLSEVEAGEVGSFPNPSPQISVIVPTRNEADNVRPLLERLARALDDFSFETIFVDDSSDNTAGVVASAAGEFAFPIRVIVRAFEQRNGLSGAVVDGIKAANGAWICVMDADLQHPPETIKIMWEQAQKTGADIVVGSRRGDLFGPYGLSRLRSFNSKVLTILARTLFPRLLKNASDPLTGLFLVRRSAVNVDVLQPDGFKILLEILVRCPTLHVTEVHFEFAPRHSGESKADVREGARFLRHLITLRTTANLHLERFLVIVVLSLIANAVLMRLLLNAEWTTALTAAFISAEVTWLGIFLALEFWVFSERDNNGRRRRFWGFFLLTQLAIAAVQLPVFYVLYTIIGTGPLAANLLAFVIVALVRYLLSEQWVWTHSAMAWQPQSYYYNLHELVRIESHVPFRELENFSTDFPPAEADIHIRIDRQGTPSRLPGGISYDDQLGRFGFGLSVLPGKYTQIVASPMLEKSPDFLYTNVVEPVLRWRLVQEDHALVNAACVAKNGRALLISAEQDLGPVVGQLCRDQGYSFLGDDLVILNADGRVFSYPKPLTADNTMVSQSGVQLRAFDRLALVVQRLLYTRFVRRIGLWISRQDLPAATVNSYIQRLIPQPKKPIGFLYPGTPIQDNGVVNALLCAAAEPPTETSEQFILDCLQQRETIGGFQPHPLLASKLRNWEGEDLFIKEQQIILDALHDALIRVVDLKAEEWWLQGAAQEIVLPENGPLPVDRRRKSPEIAQLADTHRSP